VTRRTGLVLGASAVALGAVLAVALSQRQPSASLGGRRLMSVRTSISPRSAQFGDPLVAVVDILFDRRHVDPRTKAIRIDAPFEPYEQVGSPVVLRTDVGDLVRLRYRYVIDCLAPRCVPNGERREVELPPVRVFYNLKEIRSRANDSADWPTIQVGSRVSEFAVAGARWRASVDPPIATYRMSPGTLGAVLVAASALLVLAAAALGYRLLAPAAAEPELVPVGSEAPPLERALAGVRVAFSNGAVSEQRKALEALARELGRVERDDLAARARRLAWSPARPPASEVERLTEEAER
jgi:hypothetical protein